MADWYPTRRADRPAWHDNFKTEATATGTTHNLTAGNVTQIGVDAQADRERFYITKQGVVLVTPGMLRGTELWSR